MGLKQPTAIMGAFPLSLLGTGADSRQWGHSCSLCPLSLTWERGEERQPRQGGQCQEEGQWLAVYTGSPCACPLFERFICCEGLGPGSAPFPDTAQTNEPKAALCFSSLGLQQPPWLP